MEVRNIRNSSGALHSDFQSTQGRGMECTLMLKSKQKMVLHFGKEEMEEEQGRRI